MLGHILLGVSDGPLDDANGVYIPIRLTKPQQQQLNIGGEKKRKKKKEGECKHASPGAIGPDNRIVSVFFLRQR